MSIWGNLRDVQKSNEKDRLRREEEQKQAEIQERRRKEYHNAIKVSEEAKKYGILPFDVIKKDSLDFYRPMIIVPDSTNVTQDDLKQYKQNIKELNNFIQKNNLGIQYDINSVFLVDKEGFHSKQYVLNLLGKRKKHSRRSKRTRRSKKSKTRNRKK